MSNGTEGTPGIRASEGTPKKTPGMIVKMMPGTNAGNGSGKDAGSGGAGKGAEETTEPNGREGDANGSDNLRLDRVFTRRGREVRPTVCLDL